MSKYRRIALAFVFMEIIMLIWGNIYLLKARGHGNDKLYKVDISRIVSRMENGEALEQINLDDYKTIKTVELFVPEKKTKTDYAVEEVGGKLYRFEYFREENVEVFIYVNIAFSFVIVATIILLVYLDRNVISPFNRMNHLTRELAKGNLSTPVTQEKSRYFKEFLWRMDMLREKLEDDRKRELELIKDKKTLILSLSHDIKTPLATIDLYTKALKSDLYDSAEGRMAAIEGIENNISEIKHYVSEINTASREDFLSLEVNNGEVYLHDVVKAVNDYYEDKCKQLHIDFRVEPVENCLVFCDLDRIVEVIQNIIENAVKYGDGKNIDISFDEEENCKLVTVTNTGCSLGEDEMPHLFDSFYRGRNSDRVCGSGLGLYICKELMHKMDGEAFAKINEDKFSVTLVLRKM